jgi:hypothetical protein
VRREFSVRELSRHSHITGFEEHDMSYAERLLDTYSTPVGDAKMLAATIDALDDCAQACTADADADLAEQSVAEMITCIRLCLDCADVCTATSRVISRRTAFDPALAAPLLEACAALCARCGDECEHHASTHPHCRVCEEACRRCERACRELLAAIA